MRLLLHICCGPCSIYPIRQLAGNKFDKITGFYYNPNIHPLDEYERRKLALRKIEKELGMEVIYPDYRIEEYFQKIALKENPPDRCTECWRLRLYATADFALKNKFDAFTTTLLISPYQNHELVRDIGSHIAKEKRIEFYYEDFRAGFGESQQEAREMELYRQKYCGCVFSELERLKDK